MSENIPEGWHWGVGEVCGGSKTYWFYSNLRFHYRGQMYTDPGQPWQVQFYEELGMTDDGDIEVSEYACESGTFETENEALEFLFETAKDLIDY